MIVPVFPIAVQIVAAIGVLPVRPIYGLAIVAVGDVECVDLVGCLQCNHNMPDFSCVVIHSENNVPRPDLGQIFHTPPGIGIITEDQGADRRYAGDHV